MAFDIFKTISGLNPFKKKITLPPPSYSRSPEYAQPTAYPQTYPSAPQATYTQSYPQPYAAQYPPQPYPYAQQPMQQTAPQQPDDSVKTKINLVLSEIDTLKAQMQMLNEKLGSIEGYLRQGRAMR
jgi:hypothetical protein